MDVITAPQAAESQELPQVEAQNFYETERGKPMPSTNHSTIQLNLGTELKLISGNKYRILSELNLELGGVLTVPDLSIYPFFQVNFQRDVLKRTDPPLTTIEILSPSQALKNLVDKTEEYLAAGVKSAWVVIPELEAIAVYHAPGKYTFFNEKDILKDEALGIEIPLERVFQ